MKLYLSSYKLGNREDYLKEWISNHNNIILLINNSKDHKVFDLEQQEKLNSYIKMLEDIGFKVELLDLRNYFGKYEELVKKVGNYSAFFVVGGNVFVLRQAYKLSGFDKYLIVNKDKDILYAGFSAGSCVLSPSLEGLDIVDEAINPYNNDKVIYDGLNLINFTFVPHYKSLHEESALIDETVDYLDKNSIKYKTISDGEVLIIEE